jgi:hypothetical protein
MQRDPFNSMACGFGRLVALPKPSGHRIFCLILGLLCCITPPVLAAATGCADARASAAPELQAAREKLALSERTRDRVTRQLAEIKQSGKADSQTVQDYTTYLQRVQDLVDENRRLVRKLEALCTPEANLTAKPAAEGRALPSVPVSPGEELDDVAALDRKLQDSLASFDEMLLKRINAIQAESADKMRDLAQQAAQAAGRARQHGSTTAAQSSGSSEGKEGKQGSDGSQGQKGTQGEENARQGRKAGSMGTAAGNGQAVPGREATGQQGEGRATSQTSAGTGTGAGTTRAYNPDDDDIVARQLREAAEQETDPELKKKLWKEYEEYKKNTRP